MAPAPLDHGNESKDDGSKASSAIVVHKVGAIAGNQASTENNAPPASNNEYDIDFLKKNFNFF